MADFFLDQEAFRQQLAACQDVYDGVAATPLDLKAAMSGDDLTNTAVAQPALFALHTCVWSVLEGMGVKGDYFLGHSLGEISAAYAAGHHSLEDAMKIVYHRARMMAATAPGVMAAVRGRLPHELEYIIESLSLQDDVAIASHNAPRDTVLAGSEEGVRAVLAAPPPEGQKRSIGKLLAGVKYAFHSPTMTESLTKELESELEGIQPLDVEGEPFYSTVVGGRVSGSTLTAEYWARQVRARVRFGEAMEAIGRDTVDQRGDTVFLEVGAAVALKAYMKQLTDDTIVACADVVADGGLK